MVSMLTDVGNVRSNNEDCLDVYEDEDKGVYVIADGMGGYNAGEIASSIAVRETINYIKALDKIVDGANAIETAIELSNSNIYHMSVKNENLKGMGTTITACLLTNGIMYIGHVGDSSCYIIKDNVINKVTKDHSLVQQLLDSGSISEEEALVHPNKNIITRALGTNANVKVDLFKLDLKDIDKVVLCTDGLTNAVTQQEILNIITYYDNDTACEKLVELSKEKGGRDNISVIVFEGEGKYDRNLTGK